MLCWAGSFIRAKVVSVIVVLGLVGFCCLEEIPFEVMERTPAVVLLCLMVLSPWVGIAPRQVSASPPDFVSNAFSALLKWIWTFPTSTKTGRSVLQFESGYMVETVFDGSKLGIEPYSIEVSPDGELLILDSGSSNILRITPPLSRYSRARLLAGSAEGYSGYVDGRPREARFNHPKGFTVDDKGNVYIADTMNMAIRKISEAGIDNL